MLRETKSAVQVLYTQVKWALLAFVHTHDNSDFYGGVAPLMGWFAGVPLLLGFSALTIRLRRPSAWLPLLWLFATALAGGALMVGPPHYPRYVLAGPAAALLVGQGIVFTLDMLPLRRFRRCLKAKRRQNQNIRFFQGFFEPFRPDGIKYAASTGFFLNVGTAHPGTGGIYSKYT